MFSTFTNHNYHNYLIIYKIFLSFRLKEEKETDQEKQSGRKSEVTGKKEVQKVKKLGGIVSAPELDKVTDFQNET